MSYDFCKLFDIITAKYSLKAENSTNYKVLYDE